MSILVVAVIAVIAQVTYGQWGSNSQAGSPGGFNPAMTMGGGMNGGMASTVGGQMNGPAMGGGMNGEMAPPMGGQMNGGMAPTMGGGMSGGMAPPMGGAMNGPPMGRGMGSNIGGGIGPGESPADRMLQSFGPGGGPAMTMGAGIGGGMGQGAGAGMGPVAGMGQGFGPGANAGAGMGGGMGQSFGQEMGGGMGSFNGPNMGGNAMPAFDQMNQGGVDQWNSGVSNFNTASGGWGSSASGTTSSTDGWNAALGASLGTDMGAMSSLAGLGAAASLGLGLGAGVPVAGAVGVGVPVGAAVGAGFPVGTALGAGFPMGGAFGAGFPMGGAFSAGFPMGVKGSHGSWGQKDWDKKSKMDTTITCAFEGGDFIGAVTFRSKKNSWGSGWGKPKEGVKGTLDVTSTHHDSGTFILALTQRSRVESECSADGLGPLITRKPWGRTNWWGSWGHKESHGLGTITVESGQSRIGVQLENLPLEELEEYAGRGFALCTDTEADYKGNKICKEPIVACCKLGFDNQDGVTPTGDGYYK